MSLVITSYDKGISILAETLANARERLDLYIDSSSLKVFLGNKLIKKAFLEVLKANVRIRGIMDVSKENVPLVRELVQLISKGEGKSKRRSELRRLTGIEGCLLVTESQCMICPLITVSRTEITLSDMKSFVRQHQSIFNILWNNSISADSHLSDLEEGKTPEIIETIVDPAKVLETIWKMFEYAQKEILVVFSSANAWVRQERAGSFNLLMEISKNRNLSVRILAPRSQHIESLRTKLNLSPYNIKIQYIQEFSQIKVSIVLVDRITSLIVETKDDETVDSLEAIGLTTYSTSRSTVLSYLSIFESFWHQSEIYEQSINELQHTKEYLNKIINEMLERRKVSDRN